MAELLPRLRAVLDVLPSGDDARPGVLLRDPYHYSDSVLYLPPVWALALGRLDGEHTGLDVQELLTRATGQLVFSAEVLCSLAGTTGSLADGTAGGAAEALAAPGVAGVLP